MRVMSWNMYCFNKRLDEALAFIQSADADVLCIQEVPHTFLPELTKLGMKIAYTVDSEAVKKKEKLKNYNVILSRLPMTGVKEIKFPTINHPQRTKIVIKVMRVAGWTLTKNRNAVVANVKTPRGLVQVFCAHLTLSSPSGRADEFAAILRHRNATLPAVIAGDFNVLEHPRVKPLSWFLGASIEESSPTYPERKLFEGRFKNAQFKNPLKGSVTHNFSKSQLDHVLVSEDLSVTQSVVLPERYGSDHYPVFVTFE